jgi:hypothetical protein
VEDGCIGGWQRANVGRNVGLSWAKNQKGLTWAKKTKGVDLGLKLKVADLGQK